MKIYSNGPEAIYDLHKKGYSNDFQLLGNDLVWVQENVSIRAGELAILEYYKIPSSKHDKNILTVFGIFALYHNIKGIFIIVQCRGYRLMAPGSRLLSSLLHKRSCNISCRSFHPRLFRSGRGDHEYRYESSCRALEHF